MPDITVKRFDHADEIREFPNGRFEVVRFGAVTIGRAAYQPGWKWSEHVGPQLNATRCPSAKLGWVAAGAAAVAFDDGQVFELRAGDVFHIPPVPHDSWVIGDEPYVSLHLMSAEGYAVAQPRSGAAADQRDPHCFVCGVENSVGLGVTFQRDTAGGSATTYVARAEHEGWPG